MSTGPWWALTFGAVIVLAVFGVAWWILRTTPHEWVPEIETQRRCLDSLGKAVDR